MGAVRSSISVCHRCAVRGIIAIPLQGITMMDIYWNLLNVEIGKETEWEAWAFIAWKAPRGDHPSHSFYSWRNWGLDSWGICQGPQNFIKMQKEGKVDCSPPSSDSFHKSREAVWLLLAQFSSLPNPHTESVLFQYSVSSVMLRST